MNDAHRRNIALHLPQIASTHPDELAVVVQHGPAAPTYTEYTLRELNAASDRMAWGLERYGIVRGVRTVVMVTPGFEFFALIFALFKVGAAPVVVDPGMGVKNLKGCLAEAEPEVFIGISRAHAARVVLGWARGTATKLVTVGRKWFWGGATLEAIRDMGSQEPFAPIEPEPGEMAAILFTSGSTGPPKGAVYTHAMFNAQVECLKNEYGIEPGERDLATFPLFALFGPALGMAAIVPFMDASRPAKADPRLIVHAIETYAATNMFGSPALIDVVGRYGSVSNETLPSMKRVISAGAPADPASLGRFATMLSPEAEIWPSYGATEALPVARIAVTEVVRDTEEATGRGAGVCVGRPVHGIEVAIVRITDDAIAEWGPELTVERGTIGEIAVKGAVVSAEYFNRPDATALAKIREADGSFWHRMGDVGYLDEVGRLWMCGRKSHRVDTEEGTLFTISCERPFNLHPQVRRTALVGLGERGRQRPVICVELAEEEVDRKAVLKDLKDIARRHDHTKPIETFLFHPGFPVDIRHNAKIGREQLAVWAQSKLR